MYNSRTQSPLETEFGFDTAYSLCFPPSPLAWENGPSLGDYPSVSPFSFFRLQTDTFPSLFGYEALFFPPPPERQEVPFGVVVHSFPTVKSGYISTLFPFAALCCGFLPFPPWNGLLLTKVQKLPHPAPALTAGIARPPFLSFLHPLTAVFFPFSFPVRTEDAFLFHEELPFHPVFFPM